MAETDAIAEREMCTPQLHWFQHDEKQSPNLITMYFNQINYCYTGNCLLPAVNHKLCNSTNPGAARRAALT